MFFGIGVLKNFIIFTGNMLESLINKVSGLKHCNVIEKTPPQVFLCEYYEIFQNNSFYRIPPVAASA